MQMDIHDDIVIDRVRRLGKFKKDLNRPIIVAFVTADTDLIMSSARSLANAGYEVSRNYPPLEITQARKALWPTYKNLRSKNGNTRVKFVFPTKIVVNGKVEETICSPTGVSM